MTRREASVGRRDRRVHPQPGVGRPWSSRSPGIPPSRGRHDLNVHLPTCPPPRRRARPAALLVGSGSSSTSRAMSAGCDEPDRRRRRACGGRRDVRGWSVRIQLLGTRSSLMLFCYWILRPNGRRAADTRRAMRARPPHALLSLVAVSRSPMGSLRRDSRPFHYRRVPASAGAPVRSSSTSGLVPVGCSANVAHNIRAPVATPRLVCRSAATPRPRCDARRDAGIDAAGA